MQERLRDLSKTLTPVGLTALRVVAGFVLAVHGWLKVMDFAEWQHAVADLGIPAPGVMAALSTTAELGGGLALMLGLLTPIAALMVLVNMIVAIAVVHAGQGLLLQNGGFEYPLVLAAIALFFVVRGGGPVSVDHALFGRRARRERRRELGREAPA